MPSDDPPVRVALLGDRAVAVNCLRLLRADTRTRIVLLGVAGPDRASHADDLRARVPPSTPVLVGDELRSASGHHRLAATQPDVVLSVHFPYLIPDVILAVPAIGAYNLHPGFLPYGRGWHTVSWALLEGFPVGCTLHRMTSELDGGPIVAQREVVPHALETAHELYQRVLTAEVELLADAWPDVRSWPALERPQAQEAPPTRAASDLTRLPDRDLQARATWSSEDLIRILRALTTSDPTEAMRIAGPDGAYAVRLERLSDR